MPNYSTLGINEYASPGNIADKYGLDSTDYVLEGSVHVDGVPRAIVILLHTGKANAAALNADTDYTDLPNGSIAFCGTTSLTKAVKGTANGGTDAAWA